MKQQLENLCNIYALHLLHKHLGEFLSTGCITPKQASLASEQLRSLYSQVCFRFKQIHKVLYYFFLFANIYRRIKMKIPELHMLKLSFVRFVQMRLLLSMLSITPTTFWARFWADMMETCIQNFTRRHGRILSMTRLCLKATMNMFAPF